MLLLLCCTWVCRMYNVEFISWIRRVGCRCMMYMCTRDLFVVWVED